MLLLILAATFHPYVLIYLLIPFLTFKPWSKWTYVFLGAFVAAGFALESLLGSIVDLTAMLGDTYSEEELVGEGISIFRVLVSNVPLFLTFVYRRQLFQTSSREDHLMVNLAMLNGAIMFVGLFGTAIYFSRMASFFHHCAMCRPSVVYRKVPAGPAQDVYLADDCGVYLLFRICQYPCSSL